MKYTRFSFAELERICTKEAKRISAETNIDLIVFVAKAGLPIALCMSRVLGGKFLPERVKILLRLLEVKSGFHKRNPERHVTFDADMTDAEKASIRKILVVDDSIDTGASMLQVISKVRQVFPDSEIYTYGLNVFTASEDVIKTDFFTFKDRMIKTPMSQDAEEYGDFLRMCWEYGLIDSKK